MSKQNKPDFWQVSFKYSVYEDLKKGKSIVLSYDEIKKQIVLQEFNEYLQNCFPIPDPNT